MDTYFEIIVPHDEYDEFVKYVSNIGASIEAEYEVTD